MKNSASDVAFRLYEEMDSMNISEAWSSTSKLILIWLKNYDRNKANKTANKMMKILKDTTYDDGYGMVPLQILLKYLSGESILCQRCGIGGSYHKLDCPTSRVLKEMDNPQDFYIIKTKTGYYKREI